MNDSTGPRSLTTVSVYPVVVFDLDGTLLRGTTVSLLLAQWLGREGEVSELERAFRAHEISNSVVAERPQRGTEVELELTPRLGALGDQTPDALGDLGCA